MAIAEDASTPAVARSTANSATQTLATAAFSPPAASLLVAVFTSVLSFDTTPATMAISDSASGAWASGINIKGTNRCQVTIWHSYRAAAPGSITVTANKGDTNTSDTQLTVRVLTGAASSQSGATSTFTAATPSVPADSALRSITTTTTGSVVYVGLAQNNNAAYTANANTTTIDAWAESVVWASLQSGKTAAATGTPGAITLGFTGQTSTNELAIALLEILPAAVASVTKQKDQPRNRARINRAYFW